MIVGILEVGILSVLVWLYLLLFIVFIGVYLVFILLFSSNGFIYELWVMLLSGFVIFFIYKLIVYKLCCVECIKY